MQLRGIRLLSLASAFAFATPASAAIIMVDASTIQGANVLFNAGTQTGTTVVGQTQGGTGVTFTGTTTASNVLRAIGGQARIEGDLDVITAPPNDTYLLTSLSFGLVSGGTFNNLEFNLFGGDAASVDFHLTDNSGAVWDFLGQSLGNGSNFFGFQGNGGNSIRSIAYTINGGGVLDQRQLRLDETTRSIPTPVPEPTTWATLVLGFGLIGTAMRRRRGDGLRVRYAL